MIWEDNHELYVRILEMFFPNLKMIHVERLCKTANNPVRIACNPAKIQIRYLLTVCL